MLHITQCDDPKLLPFARSRIKAMRLTGLKYISQKFEVDGALVTIRIEGEQEFVSIGGSDPAYSIFPRSMQHKDGITTVTKVDGAVATVTPYAKAHANDNVQLHTHYKTGRFDWVSFDGAKKDGSPKYGKKLITFDGYTGGRYPTAFGAGFYDCWVALNDIVINGKSAVFDRAVSGIAIKTVSLDDGTRRDYVVYASVTLIGIVSKVRFYSVPLADVFKPGRTDLLISEEFTVDGLIRQPIYFDGAGTNFVTMFTTYFAAAVTTTSILSGGVSAKADAITHHTEVFDTSSPYGGVSTLLGIDMGVAGGQKTFTVRAGGQGQRTEWTDGVTALTTDIGWGGGEYWVGDKPFARNGITWNLVDTQTEFGSTVRVDTWKQFMLFDLDIRHDAAVWMAAEYGTQSVSYYATLTGSVTAAGSGMKLTAMVCTTLREKVVRPPGRTVPPSILTGTSPDAKMFASRSDGDFMVCASIPSALDTEAFMYEEAFAGVDIEPLVFGMYKGKVRDSDLNKLGPAKADTGVRYYPITLIYSAASERAP